jgi:hypothetical protein
LSETRQLGVGRELDKLVAEKIGLKVAWRKPDLMPADWPEDWMHCFDYHGGLAWDEVPHYSTEISAAWKLVEKYKLSLLQEQGAGDDVEWMCGPLDITGIGNRVGDDLSEVGVKFTSEWRLATTAPHAVVLAFLALPAKTIEAAALVR